MSSSSATSNTVNGSSRNAPKSAIFPNVITSPGSPPGHQPPVPKDKAEVKAKAHADIHQRIVQFLAAPTSHNDPLRTLSVDQFNALTDAQLMHQAFQVLTIDNVGGTLHLADSSFVSMRQCIDEFALTSKTRDGATIKRRLLKEKLSELQDIAEVERYKNQEDDIDAFFEDDLSRDGILDFGDEFSASIKRKLHTRKQSRSADKRPHNPTNRLGVNVAIKDQHVLYATENCSLKRSKKVLNADAPALSVFPVNVLLGSKPASTLDVVLPQSDHPISSLVPAVVDAQLPTGGGGIHASSMSAAPFAASRGDGGDGGDDDDNSSSYRKASDYGTEDNHSGLSSVHSDYDGSNASDALPADYDVNFSYQDGHHSDLFENLFRTLPVDANKYRPPGATFSGVSGPLLFPPCDHPSAMPALLPNVDDGVFLPQELHGSTFEQRAQLLYLNWHVLHGVDALLDIKK